MFQHFSFHALDSSRADPKRVHNLKKLPKEKEIAIIVMQSFEVNKALSNWTTDLDPLFICI